MGLEEFHIPFPLLANPRGDLLLLPYQTSLTTVPQGRCGGCSAAGLHGVSVLPLQGSCS